MPPELGRQLSAEQIITTADGIAGVQLPSGMIPWFEGGHADPWNHVEAAMALDFGGHTSGAERAYQWMADMQRADGSWHQYYIADKVEQDKLDANVIAYVAAGAWHHFLTTSDTGFLEVMWPVVEKAVGFVLKLQQPGGEILWARHPDGTPWPFALLTGSSSIAHSIRCAIAIAIELGHERPSWELSLAQLAHAIRFRRDEAFSPKHRWAMDWYYPVLAGVLSNETGRAHLDSRFETFLYEGEGIRCVNDRPWVTAAETCECAIAYLGVGDSKRAVELFTLAQRLREPDGRYITGMVHPDRNLFPRDERSTYSSAAVLLAVEALHGTSPAAKLFADHDFLPPIIDIDMADEPAFD